MIDLHTHTFFSDGLLSPAELVRRAEYNNYRAIAITDHVDSSNIDSVIVRICRFCEETQPFLKIKLIPGIELTHIPVGQISNLVRKARLKGAKLIVLHGETVCEPVPPGTNKAGIEAGVDILAHPGLITEKEARLAASKGVFLEISGRYSHGLGNGHVLQLARKVKAKFILNTDAHAPGDLFTPEWRKKVAFGAGMTDSELSSVDQDMKLLVQKCIPEYFNV